MMVIDTSALMAIVLNEPDADACAALIEGEDRLLISAATAAEARTVAERRGLGRQMADLLEHLGLEVVSVTEASARSVAEAYGRWGKGVHAAALNFGDCFAYEAAKAHDCPLLYVGEDFMRTDVRRAL